MGLTPHRKVGAGGVFVAMRLLLFFGLLLLLFSVWGYFLGGLSFVLVSLGLITGIGLIIMARGALRP